VGDRNRIGDAVNDTLRGGFCVELAEAVVECCSEKKSLIFVNASILCRKRDKIET
jgi:hypothetical protein